MKRALRRLADQVIDRAVDRLASRWRPYSESFNLLDIAFFEAARESAEYWRDNMITARAFADPDALRAHAVSLATKPGLFLEFGVATGKSISQIANLSGRPVFGFDSFEGLPEDWNSNYRMGDFAGPLPPVPKSVTLIKGWFSDTLAPFLEEHSDPVAFLHVDCDLYSSTKCIFDLLGARLGKGSVIVFDEYFNYPGWREHEHRAFMELVEARGLIYWYEGFVPHHQSVCVVIP